MIATLFITMTTAQYDSATSPGSAGFQMIFCNAASQTCQFKGYGTGMGDGVNCTDADDVPVNCVDGLSDCQGTERPI